MVSQGRARAHLVAKVLGEGLILNRPTAQAADHATEGLAFPQPGNIEA
jgi:hypothetical protein